MKNVMEYLEASAQKYPNHLAVKDINKTITYEELLKNAQKVGSGLLNINIQRNSPVPVLMEKSINALESFFGIIYAGCFYVLLNPDLPVSRLQQIINTLEVKYLITDDHYKTLAKSLINNNKILNINDLSSSLIDEEKINKVRKEMINTDPLYANFTSGSTGVPKGVVISHQSVIDFIDEFVPLFQISHDDIIGNQAPFDFDVSVKDIYSSLKASSTLVIIPKSLFSLPVDLLDFLCQEKITTMIWAVSALCLITTFHGLDYKVPHTVKRILFSGEVMPMKHLKAWMKALPETEFVNLYGPTEITCNCTYHKIDKTRNYESGIPIGKPFNNERVILLSENNECIYDDRIGEICVTGSALALGYFSDFQTSKKSFIQNPVNKYYYERIYRTGDLGYYNEDGELYFHGRKDFQIKHMGHRVELEEIENAIMQEDGVERACCVFDESKGRLFAFYIGHADSLTLHKTLSQKLPVYMVPRRIQVLHHMPITKNGKIDRKELLKLTVRKKNEL